MSDKKNDLSDQELNDRLASLEQRLGTTRTKDVKKNTPKTGKPGFGNALRMSSEFISAIIVGALIGYLIDTFAGTTPWAMIVMVLMGFVAGVINVLRASGEMSDPYQAGWASNQKGEKDQKAADKAQNDLYDDEDE